MKVGFIGTGTITEAIITGLARKADPDMRFLVSRRGRQFSQRLADRYDQVSVFDDNQAIADQADTLVLAVRPQVAHEALSQLRVAPQIPIISLIAALSIETLSQWFGNPARITRATPLPSAADGRGVTPIFPATPIAAALFEGVGKVIGTKTLEEFDTFSTASAWLGTYFGMQRVTTEWMQTHGVAVKDAQAYLTALFLGLANTAAQSSGESLESLRIAHTTAGGLNEQFYKTFGAEGGLKAVETALASVLHRIQSGFD